ncbi:Acetyl esterase [Alphaproteobacteria bacterium SO-S41]|nr:Acetyl esterase [Alphaproteobacteria bacterium SO-S41]
MSLQTVMTRLIFSLPSGVVQAIAGKKTEVDGKTLDPRIALMAKEAAKAGAGAPPLASIPPAAIREGMKTGFALIDAKRRSGVGIKDLTVPGGDGTPLEARLYTPPGSKGGEPLIVYFHQGGCVLGGLWTCDTWCSILAEDAGIRVLNVNYRHAPEQKFPASVDDAVAAYEWAVANAASLGAGAKIGVGGDSAGGYLSAVVCHAMKKAGKPQPALQLLIYPCTDWTSTGGTMVTMATAYPLNAEMMNWFAGHYLNTEAERTDWRVSPGLLEDQSGLAPALVYTAGFDPLTTQAADYAVKLEKAGTPVKYRCYETLSHSFTAMSGAVPAARKALGEIAADVKARFAA